MNSLEITLYYKGNEYNTIQDIVNILKIDYPNKSWEDLYNDHFNVIPNYRQYSNLIKEYKIILKEIKKLWNNYENQKA